KLGRFGEWDESQHPRGKTGEGTTEGSFAPAGAADVHADHNGDGVTDRALVGVPGMAMPKTVPRLNNLTDTERAAETRFAGAYEANPAGLSRYYLWQVMSSDKPNTFSTDDAKALSQDYQTPQARAAHNDVLHKAANAIAKRAFVTYLDEVVSKLPADRQTILVTAGGVAAGKGFAIDNADATKGLAQHVGAIWDTAGEQNGTELPWVQKQAQDRGMHVVYAYVHTEPTQG